MASLRDLVCFVTDDPRIVYLDFETTGKNPVSARAVQIAVLDHAGRSLLYSMINPGVPIPPDASDVNGIRDMDVKDAPSWPQIFPQVAQCLEGKVIVAHGAAYDRAILFNESLRHGLPVLVNQWICSMRLTVRVFNLENARVSLRNACLMAGEPVDDLILHDGKSDSLAAMRLVAGLYAKVSAEEMCHDR